MTVSYISSKASGSIVTKFRVESPVLREQNCSDGSCHMTNKATLPLYGKYLLLGNQMNNGLKT